MLPAALVIFAIVLTAIWMMAHTPEYCRWCDHCRSREQDEAARQRRQRHESYHAYRPVPLGDCHDPDCPGRRE